jgi:hypothetical protein
MAEIYLSSFLYLSASRRKTLFYWMIPKSLNVATAFLMLSILQASKKRRIFS